MAFYENKYLRIKEQCQKVSDGGAAAYVTEKMVSLPERLVKCFWYDQLLDRAMMKTADGRRVKVYSPGEWNLGAGPDFLAAHIQIEGEEPRFGDVEIHVRPGGWKQHGHHKNSEYDSVILHVVMWNDGEEAYVRSAAGNDIPQLVLASCLEDDITALSVKIDMENYPYNSDSRTGLCMKTAMERRERAEQLLEMAARERFFLKARRFAQELSRHRFEEVLYAGLMEGMGYRKNKKPFRRLASIVPLRLVRKVRKAAPLMERTQAVEALLFGASGLLSDMELDLWDAESVEYFKAMNDYWSGMRGDVRNGLRKSDWTVRGVRPANFPVRRIAGVSALLAAEGEDGILGHVRLFGGRIKECSDVKEMKRAMNELCESLCVEGEGYWASRMVPGGREVDNAPALVGMPLARTLALNIVLPLLLGYAQGDNDLALRDRVTAMYALFPRLNENQIAKIMNYRMWGDVKGSGSPAREMTQQGLLQVFFDFCDENIRDCSRCAFPGMIMNV